MKILFHDVDGCLNADINTPVPMADEPVPSVQSARLRELGRQLDLSSVDLMVLNTGRSLADTLLVADMINSSKLRYIVAEHGAVYHDLRSGSEFVPEGDIAGNLELIIEFVQWYREAGSETLNEKFGMEIPIIEKVANLTLDTRVGLDVLTVFNELKNLVKNDSPFAQDQFVFHYSKPDGYVDVLGRIDKSDGVVAISSLVNSTDPSGRQCETAAVGNGINDLPMLRAVDVPVCPANSEQQVLAYCGSHDCGIVSTSSFIRATLDWINEAST